MMRLIFWKRSFMNLMGLGLTAISLAWAQPPTLPETQIATTLQAPEAASEPDAFQQSLKALHQTMQPVDQAFRQAVESAEQSLQKKIPLEKLRQNLKPVHEKLEKTLDQTQGRLQNIQQQMDQFFEDDLEGLLSTELVTINSRQAQSVAEVPNIVTVITQDEIRHSGARSLGEALNLIPGVHVRDTNPFANEGSFFTETFLMRGAVFGDNRHILVMIDGQRLNTIETGGSAAMFPLIPLENIKRIEVIRGPGSARYGTGAFTGVVNLITQEGQDVRGFQSMTSGHGHGGLAQSLNVGQKHGLWQYNVHGYYLDELGENHKVRVAGDENTNLRDGRFIKQFSLNLSHNSAFLRYQHYETDNDPFLAYGTANPAEEHQVFYKGHADLAHFGYEWKLSQGSLLFELQYARMEGQSAGLVIEQDFFVPYVIRSIQQSNPSYSESFLDKLSQSFREAYPLGYLSGFFFAEHRLEANLHWLSRPHPDHVIEAGITLSQETLEEHGVWDLPQAEFTLGQTVPEVRLVQRTLLDHENRMIRGFYLQDNFRINANLNTYLGARYDDYSDFGSTFNPRFGLVYRLNRQQVVKWLYGSAFRAPSFLERVQLTLPFQVTRLRLKPETTTVHEVAYQYGISQIYKFKLNTYRSQFNDMIFPNAEDQSANVLTVEAEGWEAELRADFRPHHTLVFNATRLFGRFKLEDRGEVGNNLLNVQTMANFVYTYPLSDWGIGNLTIVFRDRQFLPEGQSLPEYTTAHLSWTLRPPAFPYFEGFFGIRNLNDAHITSPILGGQTNIIEELGLPSRPNVMPGRGREGLAGFRLRF